MAQAAERNPRDAQVRLDLGNLYFDSERFEDAARWYQQALAIEPGNVSASTDLGISYYYLNQPDKALQQFDRSLAIDARHTKTLLNVGIVRAFGKDDLAGAAQAWQRVVEYAPESPEGKRAQQALDSLRNAHPNLPGGSGATAKPPGSSD
jgi:tetratricopeptide (TPR) repeat protein